MTLRAVALLVLVMAGLVMAGHASSAWADGCPNATLRAQNNSEALPDCRAYEMVSPPYKEGFTIVQKTFSDDGAADFTSTGVINGGGNGNVSNQYIATRSTTGWTTVAPNPPTGLYDTLLTNGADALSADLHQALWKSRRFVAPVDETQSYYLTGLDGSITRIGPAPSADGLGPYVVGASADLSHIVFTFLIAGAPLYEFIGTGNTGPGRAVSVDNHGLCPGPTGPAGTSDDGRVTFFNSTCHDVSGLWARVAGSATIAVSASQCTRPVDDPAGPCNGASPAQYVGSAADGSRVFFTTVQQLVDGDTDTTTDLYECDIPDGAPTPVTDANPCSALHEISGAMGSSARVQNVPAVSQDGTRVYIVANGVLADNLGINHAPAVDSAAGCQDTHQCHNNLYLWTTDAAHPAGKITFISDLAGGNISNARMSPDGRYLVFGTSAALVTDGPGADTDCTSPLITDCAADLYRYDAVTGAMVRVSTGVAGSGGNTPGMDATNNELRGRMTADGSTIVFATAEALSADDIDGVSDVYVWHDDGRVSLISDGRSGGTRGWVTPSGRDIFFTTAGRLTALDGDVNEDIYDARVGGGFDLTLPVPCFGDSCQARPSPVPGLPGPSAGGSGDRGGEAVVPAFSVGAVSATQRRRLAQTGKLALVVKANTPGVVTVSGSVTGLPAAVTTTRKTIGAPATVRLTVMLSRKARSRLAARGRLSVGLVIAHSKVALSRSMTLRLTHTKTKTKKTKTKKARVGSVTGTSERAGVAERGSRS